jgi:hypothetical protein
MSTEHEAEGPGVIESAKRRKKRAWHLF